MKRRILYPGGSVARMRYRVGWLEPGGGASQLATGAPAEAAGIDHACFGPSILDRAAAVAGSQDQPSIKPDFIAGRCRCQAHRPKTRLVVSPITSAGGRKWLRPLRISLLKC